MAKMPSLEQASNVLQFGVGGRKIVNAADHVKITDADGTTLVKTKMADAVANDEGYTKGQADAALTAKQDTITLAAEVAGGLLIENSTKTNYDQTYTLVDGVNLTYNGLGSFESAPTYNLYVYDDTGGTSGDYLVVYKDTLLSTWAMGEFATDPSTWVAGSNITANPEPIGLGTDEDVDGQKRPNSAEADISYTASTSGSYLSIDGTELTVNVEDSLEGTAGTLASSAAIKAVTDAKEDTITAGTTAQYYRGDKSFQTLDATAVGLANVDNTSDADKPVSTAGQTALDLKANDADVIKKDGSVAFTGSVDAGTNKVVNVVDGVAATDAATIGQVNTAIANNSVVDFQNAVAVITNLPSHTYDNGIVGVGATHTQDDNVAWDVADSDDVTLSVNDVVLMPSAAFTSGLTLDARAGVYVVTQLGDGSTQPTIFTRATPADQSSEWLKGRICRVNAGGTNYGSKFYQYQGDTGPILGTGDLSMIEVGDVSLGTNTVGESELDLTTVDADTFAISAAYTQGTADVLPAIADSIETAVEKLSGIVDVSGNTPANYTAADDTLATHLAGIDAEMEGWNKVFATTVGFGDTDVLLHNAPSGSTIMEVEFIVNTAFDGTAPTFTVGTVAENDRYVVSTDGDLTTVDGPRDVTTVKVRETFGSNTPIRVYLTPDSSTVGSVDVFVRLRK